LRAKVAAATKRAGDAEKSTSPWRTRTCAEEWRARALFAPPRRAGAGKHASAVKLFAELGAQFPDAKRGRRRAAMYGRAQLLELGDEASLYGCALQHADDYPDGDMLAEGCFRLALRRMDKHDFKARSARSRAPSSTCRRSKRGAAATLPARALLSWRACWFETGETEKALALTERLIAELRSGYTCAPPTPALSAGR